MKIKQHSQTSITIYGDVGKDNSFEVTRYTGSGQNNVSYSRNLYKIYESKLTVPKSGSECIQQRLDNKYAEQLGSIEKNQGLPQRIRLIPSNYRYIVERQTLHKCSLCGGQHYTLDCPLKQERQKQVSQGAGPEIEQQTFSVCLDPVPNHYDKGDVSKLVQAFFEKKRQELNRCLDRIFELKQSREDVLAGSDEEDAILLELEELEPKAAAMKFLLKPELCGPSRIVMTKSKINAYGAPSKQETVQTGDSFRVFVHFAADEPARLLAAEEHIKLSTENTLITAQYQGQRAQNKR